MKSAERQYHEMQGGRLDQRKIQAKEQTAIRKTGRLACFKTHTFRMPLHADDRETAVQDRFGTAVRRVLYDVKFAP